MKERDYSILLRIKKHCEEIYKYVERFGNDFEVFSNDSAFLNATAMQIFQIGELSNHFTDEFIENTRNEIPWRAIVDMRNLIGHEYKRMDVKTVWDTVQLDLPLLNEFSKDKISEYKQNQNIENKTNNKDSIR